MKLGREKRGKHGKGVGSETNNREGVRLVGMQHQELHGQRAGQGGHEGKIQAVLNEGTCTAKMDKKNVVQE